MAEEPDQRSTPKSCMMKILGLLKNRELWKVVFFGQCFSLFLCGTGTISQLLQNHYKVVTPGFQSFLVYLTVALTFTPQLALDYEAFKEILVTKWWKYLILAIIDMEANYLVVKAYNYTSLTSVQVLDCLSVPTVLILSWLILKVRYKLSHIFGVVTALIGIVCLVIADQHGTRAQGTANDPVKGDVLVSCGAVMYGISNVAEEFIVKNFSIGEFLGMMGLFGSVVSGIQVSIIEHENIAAIQWTYPVVLCFIGFVLCMYSFYSLMPRMMKLSSAATVNISLLTADLYTLFLGLYLFKYTFSILYFVSFALIICGLVIYNLLKPPLLTQNYTQFQNPHDQPSLQQPASENSAILLTDSTSEDT